MFDQRFYYLIELQYLGFRYHGWQKQPGVKTVEEMVHKTIKWVLKEERFKILASGRTDAKVSVNQTAIELFLFKELANQAEFLEELNHNFPADIKALAIRPVTKDFNIIQHPKVKEYLYFFSYGEKNHPFAAPFMTNISEDLDIEIMKEGAKLLQGKHNFKNFCARPSEHTKFIREVSVCEIVNNTRYTANFFPEQSYFLKVEGSGFMRYQVRLMMGSLFLLGTGKCSMDFFKKAINADDSCKITWIAPASGLILQSVKY